MSVKQPKPRFGFVKQVLSRNIDNTRAINTIAEGDGVSVWVNPDFSPPEKEGWLNLLSDSSKKFMKHFMNEKPAQSNVTMTREEIHAWAKAQTVHTNNRDAWADGVRFHG